MAITRSEKMKITVINPSCEKKSTETNENLPNNSNKNKELEISCLQ